MPTTIQLSAWAVPAFMDESPVDHTWVTSYDNRTQNFADVAAVIAANQNYWFCWGDYHAKGGTPTNPSGFLGSQSGALNVASALSSRMRTAPRHTRRAERYSHTASTGSAINSPIRFSIRRGPAASSR
jgi:hypothetical protein